MGSYAAGAGLAKEKQQKFVNFGKAFLGLGGAHGALAKWERSWAAGKKGCAPKLGSQHSSGSSAHLGRSVRGSSGQDVAELSP